MCKDLPLEPMAVHLTLSVVCLHCAPGFLLVCIGSVDFVFNYDKKINIKFINHF